MENRIERREKKTNRGREKLQLRLSKYEIRDTSTQRI